MSERRKGLSLFACLFLFYEEGDLLLRQVDVCYESITLTLYFGEE